MALELVVNVAMGRLMGPSPLWKVRSLFHSSVQREAGLQFSVRFEATTAWFDLDTDATQPAKTEMSVHYEHMLTPLYVLRTIHHCTTNHYEDHHHGRTEIAT